MTAAAIELRAARGGGRRAREAAGFTLLEMMIALSILAISLTWLIEASIRAVDAENHAKLMTTGTFLARQVMVDLEDELQEKGMQDDAFASEKTGDFEDDGFKRFHWKRVVDKIELPGQDAIQTALGGLTGGTNPGGGSGPGGLLGGLLGGQGPSGGAAGGLPGLGGMSMNAASSANLVSGQFGIIKDVLEQGIRRVTVTITWSEHGGARSVELAEYLTDPRRVDQAIALPMMGGMPGAPATGNPSSTSPTGPSTSPTGPSTGPR